MSEELSDKHYLGTPCKRGHKAEQDPGRSVRFKTSKGCVACSRIQQQPGYARINKPAGAAPEEQLANRRAARAVWYETHKDQCAEYNRRPEYKEKALVRDTARRAAERLDQDAIEKRRSQANTRYNRDVASSREKQNGYRKTPEGRRKARLAKSKWLAKNPQAQIKKRLRSRLGSALRLYSKTGKIFRSKDYGIDYQAIVDHLGPCPGPRAEWHIDHITPCCHFDLNDLEQVKLAFAPENHQWLLASENQIKATTERRRTPVDA